MMSRMEAPPLAGHTLVSKDGQLALAEWSDEGESSKERPIAGLHVHHSDDEAWYVLEGTLGFRLGDGELEAPDGSAVLARRGVPHTYWNAGEVPARYILVLTSRIARLLEEIHEPEADVHAIFARYDSEILDLQAG